jgi:hypothetical protein
MAPDVVLEVDHINPVKNGGKNEIINLLTSCYDCNRGKGAKLLSDNQVIKQQQEQLKEINERREQLKLMLSWKKELSKFEDEQVEIINSMISDCSTQCLNDYGKAEIKKHIKKYGISEVIESTRLSIEQYHKGDDENISKVINYIPRICLNRITQKNNPYFRKTNYIKGIIKNRFGCFSESRVATCLKSLVISEEDYETICDFAKTARNWTEFWKSINEYYEGGW